MTDLMLLDDSKYTESEIQVFDSKYLDMMKNLSSVVEQKKKLELQEKKVKDQLSKVMDEYGIKSIDNQYLKITRTAGSEGTPTIDLEKMQKKEPKLYMELLADYPKVSGARKAGLRFDVK